MDGESGKFDDGALDVGWYCGGKKLDYVINDIDAGRTTDVKSKSRKDARFHLDDLVGGRHAPRQRGNNVRRHDLGLV